MAFASAEPLRPPRTGRARRARIELADGARTTVHVACHDAERTEIRVALLRGTAKLEPWCAQKGVEEALVGGFFVRPDGTPLGEVRTRGVARRHVPFEQPWDGVRACVHVQGGSASIVWRHELPEQPRGDLLQAGPLLVRGGAPVFTRAEDLEGFSAGQAQFDSDITDGRHPRAALGLAGDRFYAVACDGRSRHDAGLTLEELTALMAALGCETAINLDGGGSTSLVSGGRLRNRPRGGYEMPETGGRPVSTALLFVPRPRYAAAAAV
jgi:Phosphodiester glycosidase